MRWLVSLWVLFWHVPVSADTAPLMASISVELAAEQSLPLQNSIQATLVTSEATKLKAALGAWEGIDILQATATELTLTITPRPVYNGSVETAFLADSFVIDINEPSTKQFASEFMHWVTQPWKLSDLTEYVNQYIDQPSYIHGFNFASVVATQRSGDCTEYAALTTALARSLGLPARLVVGTVIVEESTSIQAFGHAWTEVYYENSWQIIDAALLQSTALKHFYLPASALTNEGPGYAMALVHSVGLMPEKIVAVSNAR